MKLTMLGTGNATVTKCYNTCFVITNENGEHLLVDGGGGNQLLCQLEQVEMSWKDMQHIFITHKHIDHLMGIIWLVRLITQNMRNGNYTKEAFIYGHAEVIEIIRNMSHTLLVEKNLKYLDTQLKLVVVEDGQEMEIIGKKVTFFDIQSTKAKQFGFSMMLNDNDKRTCCGDEPYRACEELYARDSKWLLHEAFCLDGQADIFHPYEKKHSTVKDACEQAETLNVANLVLYHTEDKTIENRKELYGEEGRAYYSGNLWIPDDLEVIEL